MAAAAPREHLQSRRIDNRDPLRLGQVIQRPALIEEYTTTIVLPPANVARAVGSGELVIGPRLR